MLDAWVMHWQKKAAAQIASQKLGEAFRKHATAESR
jgi:hypothetical protein